MDGLDEETQLALALSASEADEAERARSVHVEGSTADLWSPVTRVWTNK